MSETSFNIVQVIEKARENLSENWRALGAALYVVKEQKLYKNHASHVRTYDQFLADIGMARSTAYKMLSVHKKFGHIIVNGVSPDRIVRMLPLDLTEDEKVEYMIAAKELPAKAFNDMCRAKRGLRTSDVCSHSRIKMVRRCLDCNSWLPDEDKNVTST